MFNKIGFIYIKAICFD